MRLSLTILLFTFAFFVRGNTHIYKHVGNEIVSKAEASNPNVHSTNDVAGNYSTKSHELKQGVLHNTSEILRSQHRHVSTSVEARHFLDGFFLSFIAYYSARHINATDDCIVHHIATDRALLIIYPYHSFW
ncbi:hypothetical protein [Segetibacter aerophilus]|uniref:hypothetical protein n=1 Tax=Segetibacter aerophilus TaxID=670293 RepID=UPI0011BF8370|nr:hypothetical protein [Segetibacter aerophilus]